MMIFMKAGQAYLLNELFAFLLDPLYQKLKPVKEAIKTAKSFALNCNHFVQTPTCVIIKS